MPVIVIGADTALGEYAIDELSRHNRDIRAFVSDPTVGAGLRNRGIRVAVGDVSDGSHLGGAAAGCFSAILVPEAAFDGRLRSFADSPAATVTIWASAVDEASVQRLILLEDGRIPDASERFAGVEAEIVVIPTERRSPTDIAIDVSKADNLDSLPEV